MRQAPQRHVVASSVRCAPAANRGFTHARTHARTTFSLFRHAIMSGVTPKVSAKFTSAPASTISLAIFLLRLATA